MNCKKQLTAAAASAAMIFQPLLAAAAPGALSQDPLFIGAQVQPNILFVVDDSGSMSNEDVRTAAARTLYPSGRERIDLCSGSCQYVGGSRNGQSVDVSVCRDHLRGPGISQGRKDIRRYPDLITLDFMPNSDETAEGRDLADNRFRCTVTVPHHGVAEMLEHCAGYNAMAYDPQSHLHAMDRGRPGWQCLWQQDIVYGAVQPV